MSNPYDGGIPPYEPPTGGPYGEYGGYGAPNPYGDPYRSSAPTDGVSIAALICSLTCCAAPVGIGLGIAGIVRTKGGKRSGRWAAITGLVIGAVLMVAMLAFVVFAGIKGSQAVWEDDARVGQCVNIDEFFGDLTTGECNEPHEAEVIFVEQFDDETADQFATLTEEDFCLARDLAPEYRTVIESGDYTVKVANDAFDEDDPDDGDWFVCYVQRSDGEDLDGRLTEGSGSTGA
ncbi:MAG: DUF4190 domain-containing protein [Propionibacteriales bacterium]|nr:DUF4190 domain-containing protein [Propionibacteriales bacterium]